ncbi:nitroreductase family protein [Terrisporobacter glycolicus]|uniref:Protein DrgA n=1 Tax=Terrisporobacter glycolicus ATCC 14880 = DSM 1288 TaxID=1121315 RepID=A0ABZ2EVM9_9FIRM|nr:nitroreductase family protein [Terrisporobacter glycolicus]
MSNLDFIYKRKSVRKFKDEMVPKEAIDKILKAATFAPSARNRQNWHFVVIRDKNKINDLAQDISNKADEYINKLDNEDMKNDLKKMISYYTIFKNAPVLILIYGSTYENDAYNMQKYLGEDEEKLQKLLFPAAPIQNISAAMENLLLAASNMGYGTCWMTGPIFAIDVIENHIDFKKERYELVAMTPLGVPTEEKIIQPSRKSLEEVVTYL